MHKIEGIPENLQEDFHKKMTADFLSKEIDDFLANKSQRILKASWSEEAQKFVGG